MLGSLMLPDRFRIRLGEATGRGVVIGVVDSGFNHRGLIPDSSVLGECELQLPAKSSEQTDRNPGDDRLGHGTACLTTAYRVAPGAAFRSIRLFLDDLRATADMLCRAIEAAEATAC